jgi:hypothetical protein
VNRSDNGQAGIADRAPFSSFASFAPPSRHLRLGSFSLSEEDAKVAEVIPPDHQGVKLFCITDETSFHSRPFSVIMPRMKTTTKKRGAKVQEFTPAEQRSARADRVKVFEAEPYGWIAQSESGVERGYHLFRDPETRALACIMWN